MTESTTLYLLVLVPALYFGMCIGRLPHKGWHVWLIVGFFALMYALAYNLIVFFNMLTWHAAMIVPIALFLLVGYAIGQFGVFVRTRWPSNPRPKPAQPPPIPQRGLFAR